MIRPISISLSPNVEKDDLSLASRIIRHPSKWKRGLGVKILEEQFRKLLGVKHAIAFNSGRSSLTAILSSQENKGEVFLQAFTCNAATNPVQWSGFSPVFVDCNKKDFNIDPEDLEKKITQKSKILMVQHTFGMPADMDNILKIAEKNNLLVIEDCAHSLGAEFRGRKVGTLGDAAFFSFSRDKIISSVYGGIVVTNDDLLAQKIKSFQKNLKYPSSFWVLQQLLHPLLMEYLILPTYSFLGKYLLVLFQHLKILSKAVHWKEKRGRMPSYFPKKMPNALALLALKQLEKLDRFNSHRKKTADFYYNNLKMHTLELPQSFSDRESVFLRFTVKSPKAHKIITEAWKKNILIGDWYTWPVAPEDTMLEKVQYKKGSCPKAEELSEKTFNLPTGINIKKEEREKIVYFLNNLIN